MTHYYWPAAWRRQHCGKNCLEVVHDIVAVPHLFDPRFYPTDEELAQAHETRAGRRVIAWCLAGSRFDKIYPYTGPAIARLIHETGASVIVIGASTENEQAQAIRDHVRLAKLQFAMEQPIRQSLTLAGVCDLVIGPDTGLMWGVSMESMPKIVLLGHAWPRLPNEHHEALGKHCNFTR